MKLKLIVSLLTIVGLSACSTAMENQSCTNYQDFQSGQNCTFRDKSNDNSTKFKNLREKNTTGSPEPSPQPSPQPSPEPSPEPIEDDVLDL